MRKIILTSMPVRVVGSSNARSSADGAEWDFLFKGAEGEDLETLQ